MKQHLNLLKCIVALASCTLAGSPAFSAEESQVRFNNHAGKAPPSGTPTLSVGSDQPIVAARTNSPSKSAKPPGRPAVKPLALAPDSTSTNETGVTYQIPENSILEFPVPLTQAAQISLVNSSLGYFETARAGIAVPADFNPTNAYPMLIVCGTSDGDASSIRAMRSFTNVALRLGFVVAAADGPFGKPTNDTPVFRFAMLSSVLEHMHRSWPASRGWPIVCAGFSGGGKWAGVIGAGLNSRGYRVIGLFQGAVNQDYTTEAARMYSPALRYRATPIYLSSGTEDKIATPQQHEEVRRSLLATGFSMVRLENHEGGHSLDQDHLEKALNWFIQLYKLQAAHAQAAFTNAAAKATSRVRGGPSTNRNRAVSTGRDSDPVPATNSPPLQ